jgi:dynein heavy chain 1
VDQKVLDKLINTLFVPESFNLGFALVSDVAEAPTLPEGTSKDECFAWIASLASHTPPTWVGLDADAEKELEVRKAKSIKEKIDLVAAKEVFKEET